MQLPLQITFRGMERSEAMEAAIREKAEKLDQFHERIMSCRVMVEPDHKHHHQGTLYRVRVDITVPGDELVVSREPGLNHAHEDAYVAIRDAFDAAGRQLKAYVRRRRGKVKTHETPPYGWISELNPGEGFGRIRTADGREVYFHRNSVVEGDFDDLTVDSEVRFVEERGDQGPQASTVKPVGKHHVRG
ncbi:MAG: HPF/RaiA family ribosome-associated protein [Gammaproteobacteria bacterium]|nr:HPF/RaiA family ribosome-associated protein [Gammaproteobacteria bacterium]NIR30171.1 HPF/RaiA family ribosome-associated protein [Gammaproteobacteria bacterium]NIR98097.1 HPF/RaiA family ribosome-associated protein [Gammaproteobacteria bacterium]NIT63787.1 HPF/RaiA family ribosome-associated protein [Gammaproteobacteria bacterium]NIV20738.1 cold shock domain-containing protein [Gammaproteobacteria bacterium]